jgi:hypothetical protein
MKSAERESFRRHVATIAEGFGLVSDRFNVADLTYDDWRYIWWKTIDLGVMLDRLVDRMSVGGERDELLREAKLTREKVSRATRSILDYRTDELDGIFPEVGRQLRQLETHYRQADLG